MKGSILDYSIQTNTGVITGDDGNRYTFSGPEWKEQVSPVRGMRVDFEVDGENASSVYAALAPGSMAQPVGGKSKVTAGLLAIILGGAGVHKFYLGFTGPGLILLAITAIGFLTAIVGVGLLLLLITGTIGLIEGIIYLTKSDSEFNQVYEVGKKSWF